MRVLSAILRTDVRSVSGKNISLITKEARFDPFAIPRRTLIRKLDKRREVPVEDKWVLDVVNELLGEFSLMDMEGKGRKYREQLKDTINVLCVS